MIAASRLLELRVARGYALDRYLAGPRPRVAEGQSRLASGNCHAGRTREKMRWVSGHPGGAAAARPPGQLCHLPSTLPGFCPISRRRNWTPTPLAPIPCWLTLGARGSPSTNGCDPAPRRNRRTSSPTGFGSCRR